MVEDHGAAREVTPPDDVDGGTTRRDHPQAADDLDFLADEWCRMLVGPGAHLVVIATGIHHVDALRPVSEQREAAQRQRRLVRDRDVIAESGHHRLHSCHVTSHGSERLPGRGGRVDTGREPSQQASPGVTLERGAVAARRDDALSTDDQFGSMVHGRSMTRVILRAPPAPLGLWREAAAPRNPRCTPRPRGVARFPGWSAASGVRGGAGSAGGAA
nr:hypothetical protein GCM10025699_68150 [Microbacterium flavescens]